MKRITQNRISLICLAFFLSIVLALPAFAAEIDVAGYGLSLRLPLSLDVLTRNMAQDDPVLALYGKTAAQVRQELIDGGLYLKAREITGVYTLTLSISKASGADFNQLDATELEQIANKLGFAQHELISSGEATFLLLVDASGKSAICLTRVGGQQYSLKLSASSALTKAMTQTLRNAALSMNFSLGQ